jgi:Response regulator receiver domain
MFKLGDHLILTSVKGLGLYLCKNLTELLGGELILDTAYDSLVPGCPGTRFIVKLNQRPVPPKDASSSTDLESDDSVSHADPDVGGIACTRVPSAETRVAAPRLPDHCSVLFVDDDPVLRKLFVRKLKTVAPDWAVREAANGETALLLVEQHSFDLIFVDQYMASVERQVRWIFGRTGLCLPS